MGLRSSHVTVNEPEYSLAASSRVGAWLGIGIVEPSVRLIRSGRGMNVYGFTKCMLSGMCPLGRDCTQMVVTGPY